ncbi:MAG: hypothetical protein H6510_04350 [Acidobacteria bacterium]|nr:hypothetical protein [Acidobacteriota bacterium]
MQPLIECIPNFSSVAPDILEALCERIQTFPVRLLGVDSGASANRTVITFCGPADAVFLAAGEALAVAIEWIKIRPDQGVHPYIGACDVMPFVALEPGHRNELAARVQDWAQEQAARFDLPIHLYEHNARNAERANLAFHRQGGLQALATRLASADGSPDFGPTLPHPTAGAMVTGLRNLLVAFNINLTTSDAAIARAIAARIREKSPNGLPGLKAIGWTIREFQCAQVSTNIYQPEKLAIHQVFERVKLESQNFGCATNGCELVGLLPFQHWHQASQFYAAAHAEPQHFRHVDYQPVVHAMGLDRVKPFMPQHHILEWAAGLDEKLRLEDLANPDFFPI